MKTYMASIMSAGALMQLAQISTLWSDRAKKADTTTGTPSADDSAIRPNDVAIRRTEVARDDLDVLGREVIQVRVDFAPGAAFGKHSHPGAEVAYVLEGSLEYQFEGEAPVTLHAGEALFIPAGTIHSAKNVGDGKASELATYVVEKDRPLVTLAK